MKIINKETLINAILAAIGGFICIGFLSYLNMSINGSIWLIPPFGASMVLVMAVPESPLAQPKNLILGHVLSALSGVLIYTLLGQTFYALGAGVALAIFVMMITNTIHPPAGANPIIVILGGKGISFVLLPVTVGALIIIIFAMIYNKILGRNYPKSPTS
jgi:CBS-domain-containing membrane protein